MWKRMLFLVAWGALVAQACGCASGQEDKARSPISEQNPLMAELGFVRAAGAGRTDVETRLGPPPETFESGRIVSYAVFLDVRSHRLSLVAAKGEASHPSIVPGPCFGLMIEYSPDGAIVRHALIRQGSPKCPKRMSP
jgi:hypothetical protein